MTCYWLSEFRLKPPFNLGSHSPTGCFVSRGTSGGTDAFQIQSQVGLTIFLWRGAIASFKAAAEVSAFCFVPAVSNPLFAGRTLLQPLTNPCRIASAVHNRMNRGVISPDCIVHSKRKSP